ncbi:MAG: alkaline phosphatase family protein [Arenimonas sp.]
MTNYARFTRHETVDLMPGESHYYHLPPMSPGPVLVNITYIPNFHGGPILRSAPGATTPSHPAGSAAGDPGVIARAPLRTPRRGGVLGTGIFDIDVGTIDPGEQPSPATDITVELFLGTQLVGSHANHLFPQVPTFDDSRYLKITRKTGGNGKSKYGIELNYPSQLPVLERRIPMAFFRKGFDENWNQHPYIENFRIDGTKITINFDDQFAKLYGMANPTVISVDNPYISFRDINSTAIVFGTGVCPDPYAYLGSQPNKELPYFFVRIECENGGDDPLDVPGVDPDFSVLRFEFRFLLDCLGELGYIAKVESPTLNSLSDNIPGVNVRELLIQKIESGLNSLQYGADGNSFGKHLAPWLIGEDRQMVNLYYVRATDEILVSYIGAMQAPIGNDAVLSSDHEPAATPMAPEFLAAQRMFDLPLETPLPPIPLIRDPMNRNTYQSNAGNMAEKFDHVVVLMMENRSFDQVLGYLSRDAGRTDVDGLPPANSPAAVPIANTYASRTYRPAHIQDTAWFGFDVSGPAHEHESVVSQMSDGMGHFVSNFAKRVGDDQTKLQRIMDYYGPNELRAYAELTSNFAICDHWFCSHVGPTWPNRFVTFTGDLNRDSEGEPELNQPDMHKMLPIGAKTFFDLLSERHVSWRCYENGYSFIRLYKKYTFDMTNVVGFNNPTQGFLAAARSGTLPSVSFIEPDYIDLPPGNDDHPPGDMKDGQAFVATIMKALMEGPKWERTLFIVTYDEHGGFYDHITPPVVAPLLNSPGFGQLGPRVPAFVMSPYIAPGTVSKKIYDHTSIAATILRRFCSPNVPKMSGRADTANDLRELFTLQTPRTRNDLAASVDRLSMAPSVMRSSARKSRKIEVTNEPDDFHGLLFFARMITGNSPH